MHNKIDIRTDDANTILSAIIHFVDEEYGIRSPNLGEGQGLELCKILQTAEENKLLYYLCKCVLEKRPDRADKRFLAGIKQGEESILKAKLSIKLLMSLFAKEGLDFLIIKTYKGLPYKTLDIDILVREEHFDTATKALEDRGAIRTDGRFLDTLAKLHLAVPGYHMKNLLKVDLYKGVLWWLPTLDDDFMWKKPRKVDVFGLKCPIPSLEADLLSLVASSLFTDRKITLLDFLYIKSLLKENPNLHLLLRETRKFGWNKEFLKVLSVIQRIDHVIYHHKAVPKEIEFPFTLPWGILNMALPKVFINKISKDPPSTATTLVNVLFHPFVGRIYTHLTSFEGKQRRPKSMAACQN